jgi:membrane protein implicated in regulation of membrane protease activity
MIALILAHPHIFWLSLGGLLLAAEMLGGNGYLLWSGIAGVVTGLLAWLLPFGWEWQGTLFAALTCWPPGCGHTGCAGRSRAETGRRAAQPARQQLVGRVFTLESPLVNGHGHVRVGDSSWPVVADEDLGAGSHVEVLAVEGITLRVRDRAAPLSLRLAVAAAGKVVDNRAIGAVIAGTGFRQRQQMPAHILQLADMALNIRHFIQRSALNVRAVPRRIVKQKNQLAALFQIKPDLPRLAQ